MEPVLVVFTTYYGFTILVNTIDVCMEVIICTPVKVMILELMENVGIWVSPAVILVRDDSEIMLGIFMWMVSVVYIMDTIRTLMVATACSPAT